MSHEAELSLESQFRITANNAIFDRLTREQAIDFLKELHQQFVAREAVIANMFKGQIPSETPISPELGDIESEEAREIKPYWVKAWLSTGDSMQFQCGAMDYNDAIILALCHCRDEGFEVTQVEARQGREPQF